jgi:hypothetical protein
MCWEFHSDKDSPYSVEFLTEMVDAGGDVEEELNPLWFGAPLCLLLALADTNKKP